MDKWLEEYIEIELEKGIIIEYRAKQTLMRIGYALYDFFDQHTGLAFHEMSDLWDDLKEKYNIE